MNSDFLFPSAGRHPYYIVAPDYQQVSAGVKVLHLLCHMLNLRGQLAFLTAGKVNPEWIAPQLTESVVQRHFEEGRTPIVVYGEVIFGNPLNAKCIARYLLNYPGLLGGPAEFPPQEMLFWYTDQMRTECAGRGSVLSLPATDAREFTPPPSDSTRRGTCYYAAKYKVFSGNQLRPPVEGSVEILRDGPGVQSRKDLIQLFRASELFYCYESSALALEAVLCGCPVVFVPNNHYKKPILLEPIGLTGMAWGDSPEEIDRAKRTVSQVLEKYDEWIQSAVRQLDGFIEETQKRAMATPYSARIRFPFDPLGSPYPAIQLAIRIRRVLWFLTPPILHKAFSPGNLKTLVRLFVPPFILELVWRVLRPKSDTPHISWIRNVMSQILPSPTASPEKGGLRNFVKRCAPPIVFETISRICGPSPK